MTQPTNESSSLNFFFAAGQEDKYKSSAEDFIILDPSGQKEELFLSYISPPSYISSPQRKRLAKPRH